MLKTINTLLLTVSSFWAVAAGADSSLISLKPNPKQVIVTKLLAEMVSTVNYKTVRLNDSISKLIFNRYIKSIDGYHNYFVKEDLERFNGMKTEFDDDLKAGNLRNAFAIFNVYRQRAVKLYTLSILAIDKKAAGSDNATFTPSRKNMDYFQSSAQMYDYWAKKVRYDLLSIKLTGTTDAKAKALLKSRYKNLIRQLEQVKAEDVFQLFTNAVTASVDPHTAYYNPFNASQFNVGMSRTLEGIGATLNLENDMVTIKGVMVGGPVYKDGKISVGDRIIAVAQGNDGLFQDIIGWRIDEAIGLIRGQKGSKVRLKILEKAKSAADLPVIVELTRDKIILDDQSAKKDVKTFNVKGRTTKIGFISIPQFYIDANALKNGDRNYKSTTRDVRRLIDSLKVDKVDGIVVDLRQNGGGSLTEAIDLTGLFIKTGPVVQVKSTNGSIRSETDQNTLLEYDGPLAVLVDRGSASASEIFAAAIQDYRRGIVIGSRTYGKGTVQTQVDLDRMIGESTYKDEASKIIAEEETSASASAGRKYFGQLNVTIGKFYRISGSSTQHLGVRPDLEFPSLIPLSEYGEDNEASALPWDTIKRTEYMEWQPVDKKVVILNRLHLERLEKSKLNNYISTVSDSSFRNATQSPVKLNIAYLKNINTIRTKKLAALNNQLRDAVGILMQSKDDNLTKLEKLDFIKIEAGNVMLDYIKLRRRSPNQLESTKI